MVSQCRKDCINLGRCAQSTLRRPWGAHSQIHSIEAGAMGVIRLQVGFEPLKITSLTAWIRWCMQVHVYV